MDNQVFKMCSGISVPVIVSDYQAGVTLQSRIKGLFLANIRSPVVSADCGVNTEHTGGGNRSGLGDRGRIARSAS